MVNFVRSLLPRFLVHRNLCFAPSMEIADA
jgi:hypothetical protein